MELALGSTTPRVPDHDRPRQLALQLRVLETLLAAGLQRESGDEGLALSQHKLDRPEEMESVQVEINLHISASPA